MKHLFRRRNSEENRPQKLFCRIFLPFFFCVTATVFISTWLYYTNFEKVAAQMVYERSAENLESIAVNVAQAKEIVSSVAAQAYFDESIFNLIYYDDLSVAETVKYLSRLASYKTAVPYAHSIYVYNGTDYYTSNQFFAWNGPTMEMYDEEILDIVHTYPLRYHDVLIPRYLKSYSPSKGQMEQSFVYTYVYSDFYAGESPDNAVIVNLTEEWFQTSLDVFSQEENQILIVSPEGLLLSTDTKNSVPALTNISDREYIREILLSGDSEGYQFSQIDGGECVVTYKRIDPEGWILLSIAQASQLNSAIIAVRNQIVLLATVIMIGSMGIVFLLSRRLFIPINTLAENNRRFQSERRTSERLKRQEAVNMLLTDSSSVTEEMITEYRLHVALSEMYLPVLLVIDDVRNFSASFNLSDRKLVLYGIANICEEIFPSGYLRECIVPGEDRLLLLLSPPESENCEEDLTSFFTQIRSALLEYIHFSCTFTVAKNPCRLSELHACYQSLLEASGLRMMLGKGSNIFASRYAFLSAREFVYPSEKETQMTEAILSFKKEETLRIVHEILSYSIQFGTAVLNSCVSRLLISINGTVFRLQSLNHLRVEYRLDLIQEQIASLETLQEIETCLVQSLDSLWKQIEAGKANRHDRLMNQVLNYIEENYVSVALCANSVAEYVGLSAGYLSKLFRQYKGVSISVYIDSLRLEKAHTLLCTGKLSVKEIMEETGFASRSHFYSLYKAKYGATPSELRKG